MENPLRRRLCLSDDEAIGAVAGDSLGENCFLFSYVAERLPVSEAEEMFPNFEPL